MPSEIEYELSREEWESAYKHWSRLAREEFTRGQIVATASDPDYRDYNSPVWWAMQDELQYRDKIYLRRMMRREVMEEIKKDKYANRRKLRLKNQRLTRGKIVL
jgi:hypothetical protein